MEKPIIVKRGGYVVNLMVFVAILFAALSVLAYTAYYYYDALPFVIAASVLDTLVLGCILYIISLLVWRIRITDSSVFIRIWYKGEKEYRKDEVVIADSSVKNVFSDGEDSKVLGNRYVIWSKATKKPITDVYDKDINSEAIKEMCINK